MTELRMDAPNEKQRRFLLDRHRHIAYGGARGGGKSWAVRTKAKLLALRYAGIKLLIVRRTLRELQNNHIDPLRQELAGVAKYKAADKRFEFPNGSVLTFGYCACDGDLGQYQGAEYDVVFLDEAGQLQKAWIDAINACVRGTNGFPKRTYYTLNPGGPSHGYFKRLFIDRRFEPGEREDAYSFVQALVTDNRVLLERQPDYLQQLETLPPKLREAWLHGSWDVYEGQFFEDFRDVPEHYRDRRMSLSRSRRTRGGRSAGAMTSGTESRFPARGGRSTMTGSSTGSWSSTAARGRRTRASSGRRTGSLPRSGRSRRSIRG